MKSPRVRRLSIVGLTMIVVIIPFCLYYLFFVESQTAYFTKRNFRVLADIDSQIKSKIDNLGTSIINAANKAGQDKNEESKPDGKKSEKPVAAGDKLIDAIELIKKSGVNLKYDPAELESVKVAPHRQAPQPVKGGREAPNANANRSDSRNMVAQAPSTNASLSSRAAGRNRAYSSRPGESANSSGGTVRVGVEAEQGSFWLNVEYRGGKNGVESFHVKCEITSLVDPFVGRYVIDELNQTQERLFDEVLVAEQESGRVIFEHGQPGLRIVSLDTLSNSKGEKVDLKLADRSSSLVNVRIAGADYKLFLQPISLTIADGKTNQEVRWEVCGLTRNDHLRDETYAVSYTVLIIFVFIVSLSALSWPLLKLKLMGPKDRLRRTDLGLTFVCGLLGTALLTFLMLDIGSYIGLENMLDVHLEELSKKIRSNFEEEIGGALAQLRELNDQMSAFAQKEHPDSNWVPEAEKLVSSPNPKALAASKSWFPEKVDLLADTVDWKRAPYPYLNSVTWTDNQGFQRIKWTTSAKTTAFVNVQERFYFTSARNGDLWKRENGDVEYVVDLVYSKNTGENVAVVATRAGGTLWVSSIDGRLMSLMGALLPANYGYAVLDSDGGVLFHSEEVKNLREQFFEECDNDLMLRAAVTARTEEFVNANYLGNGHRLFVSPLPGTPWVLVVFRDKQMARTINLELLTLSLVSYLIFSLVVLIVISCIYLPNGGERISWLWPESKRVSQYNLLVIVNTLLTGVFLLALGAGGDKFLVICCFLVPSLAVILGALNLKNRPENRAGENFDGRLSRRPFVSYRTAYLIALVGFVGLLSVLPTAGFFRIARNFEMNLLVKHGQVSIAKGLERRAQSVGSQYMAIKIGQQDEGKPAFLNRRLDPGPGEYNWDVYDSFFFRTGRTGKAFDASGFDDQHLDWINRALMKLRPLYNQSCVESQELPRAASADGIWKWEQDDEGRILLQKDRDGRPGDASVALVSTPASGVVPDTFLARGIKVIAIIILLVLVYLLSRSVTRHFFLLDQAAPERVVVRPPDVPSGHNVVLIRAPMTSNGASWDDPEKFKRIDLKQVEKWEGWARTMKSNRPTKGVSLVLEHFEHCMDEPSVTREMLQAIEQFLSEGTRVIVVSTVDPLRVSVVPDNGTTNAAMNGKASDKLSKSGEAADNKADSSPASKPVKDYDQISAQTRWSLVFSTFVTVYEPDEASAAFVNDHTALLTNLKTTRPWGYLERIDTAITGNEEPSANERDPAGIEEEINEVVDQARAYHQALWATCSQDERCALIHVALDGMISSKNKDVRQLMKRGLVVRDPAVRLMDESFRRFVISASRGEDIDAWRRAGGSTWQLIKTPLLLVLLAVALFLFVTQKDLYDSTISSVSAITAGIAILFRLLGMFQKGDAGAAPKG